MVLVIPQYIDFSWEKKPAPTSESIECDTKTNNFARKKAAELEDFQGSTASLGDGVLDSDTGTSPAKRRRMVKQDGEEIIKDFLSQVAKLPVESMTEEKTSQEVARLKEQVLARNNPYIQELLA